MVVGVCRITLLAPACHSLKEKRGVVRRIVDRVRSRFHVNLAEVDGQDTWQRAVLGFAVVSGDAALVESTTNQIIGAVEAMGLASVAGVERDVLSYGDEPFGEPDYGQLTDDWVPDEWRSSPEPGDADSNGRKDDGKAK